MQSAGFEGSGIRKLNFERIAGGWRKSPGIGSEPAPFRTKEFAAMNTLLFTSQIVCYGVGIVSASLNIATFVRRRRRWRHMQSARR